MAKELSVDEVVERARRVQEDRITAIRALAEKRRALTETRADGDRQVAELQRKVSEQIAAAEREDLKEYNAAVAAGWSPTELTKIGFADPAKKPRARRRTARTRAANDVATDTAASDNPSHGETDEQQHEHG